MKRSFVPNGSHSGLFAGILALLVLTAVTARPAAAVTMITASGPFTLSTPGETYILTTNLTFIGDGIKITADNVTLDLNGHTIAASQQFDFPPPRGILVAGGQGISGVTIRNGKVTGFLSNVQFFQARNCTITGVDASNSGIGIWLPACSNTRVQACRADNASVAGIDVAGGNYNTVQACTANHCGQGIAVEHADLNTVSFNSTSQNDFGILLRIGGSGNTFLGNAASQNGKGIVLESDSEPTSQNVVQANYCLFNNTEGIALRGATANTIRSNRAAFNGTFDLFDDNANCDSNLWVGNRLPFLTRVNQACIH